MDAGPRFSSSTKLSALLFAAIFLPALAALGFMQLASERALGQEQQTTLAELRAGLLAEYAGAGPQDLAETIQDRLQFDPHGDEVISYADPYGRPLVGNIVAWPQVAPGQLAEVTLRRADEANPVPVLLRIDVLPDGSRLLEGHVTRGNAQLARANRAGLLLAILVAAPLSLGLAFALLRVIERRAARIAAIAEGFGTGDFTQRVPVGGGRDAFDRLARALNTMLDRVAALVGELRLVTDGLAHDLRSPLTRLQVAIDQARRESPSQAVSDTLRRAEQEADALLAMLTTVLQISRAEAGIGRDRLVPQQVGGILEDLAEIYGPMAEDHGFALECEVDGEVSAPIHRELLSQALGNLIENALKYAEGGTRIVLGARREGGQAIIRVADDGPGIASRAAARGAPAVRPARPGAAPARHRSRPLFGRGDCAAAWRRGQAGGCGAGAAGGAAAAGCLRDSGPSAGWRDLREAGMLQCFIGANR